MPVNQVLTEAEIAAMEEARAEAHRLLFEAPIQELADSRKISIDEAVNLRVEQTLAVAPIPIKVDVRPIQPQGNLLGFATVEVGGVAVDNFKVVQGKNGVFLSNPSVRDDTSPSGFRSTARVYGQELKDRLNEAAVESYNRAVAQLQERAGAVAALPIKEQMAQAGKEAAKQNAARPTPAKGKEARGNDR